MLKVAACALIAGVLLACSAGTHRVELAAPVARGPQPAPKSLALLLLPSPHTPCEAKAPQAIYSAQTGVTINGRPTDSWTDIVVRAPREIAKDQCEQLVRVQLVRGFASEDRLQSVVLRACKPTLRLPQSELERAETLLVQPQARTALGDCTAVSVVHVSKFDTLADCRAMHSKLEAKNREAAKRAGDVARSYLRGLRKREDIAKDEVCGQAAEAAARCEAMANGQVLERDKCSLEHDRLVRACTTAGQLLETIRRREETVAPIERPESFCFRSELDIPKTLAGDE